jgi:pimeloyl-ACP methyl ester carboxylesterase
MLPIYISGKGLRGLFLHGFLEDQSMWDYLTLDNVQQFRVDLPGHGKSELYPYTDMIELAIQVKKTIENAEYEPEFLVGHSMGGYVALELFKMLPNCKGLILLNSNFWADSDEKKLDRSRVAEIVFEQKKLFLETAIPNLFGKQEKFGREIKILISEALKMTPESIAMASLAMANRVDNTFYIEKEERKVLLIQGANDNTVPLNLTQRKLSSESSLEMTVLNSGHMSHVECQTELEKTIENFLQRLND